MSIQFLTDEEYEAVRRDMRIIAQQMWLSNNTLDFDQVVDKLTAYVDQKIKKYY